MAIDADGNVKDDPNVILVRYYQCLEPPVTLSFKTAFRDFNDGQFVQYWRSEFHCPITHQIYHSSLNYLQLMEASAVTDLSQIKQVEQKQEYVVGSEYVYFRTKKAAQRAAAKSALELLLGKQRTLFRSSQDLWQYQHPEEQQKLLRQSNSLIKISSFTVSSIDDDDDDDDDLDYNENSSLDEDVERTRLQNKPSHTHEDSRNPYAWPERMFKLGIRSPNHFCMFFTQVSPSSICGNQQNTESNQKDQRYTLIRCCIDTFAPRRLTAWGTPAKTKTDAIASAVTLLEEILTNNNNIQGESEELKREKEISNVESLTQLRRHVPTICQYYFTLLPCFSKPIVPTVSSTLYLYELTFALATSDTNTSGCPADFADFPSLISHHCGFDQAITKLTRLGIIFPMDIMPSGTTTAYCKPPSFRIHNTNGIDYDTKATVNACFSLGSLNKNSTRPTIVNVQLTKRTIINSITESQIELARHFHDTMDLWKIYGVIDHSHQQNVLNGKNLRNTFSPMDRTYMLVPLLPVNASSETSDPFLNIDWALLSKLYNGEVTPYLGSNGSKHMFLLLPGAAFLSFVCSLFLLLMPPFGVDDNNRRQYSFLFLYAVLAISTFLLCLKKISRGMPKSETEYAQNKVLVQDIKGSRKIYTPHSKSKEVKFPLNCLYGFDNQSADAAAQENLTSKKREEHLRKYCGLDLVTATYVDYYFKKYGIQIKHKTLPLIPARVFHSTSKLAPDSSADSVVHLVPELVSVLPLPRDILLMSQYRTSFLTSLEITTLCIHVESWLRDLALKVPLLTPAISKVNKTSSPPRQRRLPAVEYLKYALCQHCQGDSNAFQRLEFVGDAVLAYYTAVNLFSRNYFLNWNVDDLEQFSSHAVKNSTIFEAALNIGIPSIIITSDATKWQSAYSRARDANDFKNHPSFELSDKNISDTVEALLGAIYLGYSEIESHPMMVGFLNELKVPFRPSQLLNFVVDLPESNPSWFTARGSCLNDDGYPFQKDKNWLDEIVKIGTIIYLENDVKTILDAGLRKMMDIFISNNASASTLNQTKFSEILLFTALFDDSLRDDEDQSLVTSSSVGADSSFARSEDSDNSIKKGEALGLVRVALFRDTLFVIGNAALMLCLAEESYNRYPSAKEGDLHMLKTWTLSNDVLAYIMVKNGFHKCLFDSHAKTTAKLIQKMSEADALGEAIWNHHGGWILAGGAAEYERRSTSFGKGMQKKPKYVGLSQGRLIEAQKKLPLELTGDLSFSMKAISGALVLSFGLKQAWEQVLLPVFEELLLISPDEWLNCGTDN